MSDDTKLAPEPTAEQLAEWRALCDAATPGPWLTWEPWPNMRVGGEPKYLRLDPCSGPQAVNAHDDWPVADVRFIAAARQALPALLADRDRLVAEKDEARERAERLDEQLQQTQADYGALEHAHEESEKVLLSIGARLALAGLTPPDDPANMGEVWAEALREARRGYQRWLYAFDLHVPERSANVQRNVELAHAKVDSWPETKGADEPSKETP